MLPITKMCINARKKIQKVQKIEAQKIQDKYPVRTNSKCLEAEFLNIKKSYKLGLHKRLFMNHYTASAFLSAGGQLSASNFEKVGIRKK